MLSRTLGGAALLAALLVPAAILAAPAPNVRESVAACDPSVPASCIKPNSDGSINVSGTITASNPSVGLIGGSTPASGTLAGYDISGVFTKAIGSVNGLYVDSQTLATQATLGSLYTAFGNGGSPAASTLLADTHALVTASSSPLPAQSSHGVNIGGVEGLTASGVTPTENPLYQGGRAASTTPTAVTDGQKVAMLMGLEGRPIVKPYSVKELDVRGYASTTGNTATTILAASGSASLKTYVTATQCYNTSATTVTVTLSDSASTVIIVPGGTNGGGNNLQFPTPLVTAANTAFTFTPSVAETTVGCSAQGYTGS